MTECTEESFLKDVSNHKMTVIRDEGIYRHVRFRNPESGNMAFDLITWPGHLCYTGDMGTYVFQRLEDMFQFFRSDLPGRAIFINTGYWSSKCISIDRESGISKYSAERAREEITELLDDHSVGATGREQVENDIFSCLETEDELRRAVDEFPGAHVNYAFRDFFEVNLHVRPYRYAWACYAIAWGVSVYDTHKKEMNRGA